MNIKIVNKMQDYLVVHTFPFGSHVYGTNTEFSDRDYLNIVNYDAGEMILQWSAPGVDHIYTDMKNFLKHLDTGASQVNFEVLHLEEFQKYYFLDPLLYYTPKTAKMYLGLAKRDLEFSDRIWHANRCIYMADKIIKKELIVLTDLAKIEIETDVELLRIKIKNMREGLFK